MKNKLFILFGGPSSEREVSFSTKDFFMNMYKKQDPVLVEWLPNFKFTSSSNPKMFPKTVSEEEFYKILKKENAILIIASHGEYVEDGYIQAKLEENNVPFTGSNSVSCKLAMNKFKSQNIVSKFVKVIPTYIEYPAKVKWKRMVKEIGSAFPIFIKPNTLGSSVGAYIINSRKELDEKLPKLNKDLEYLFQKLIVGREVSVGSVKRDTKGYLKLPLTEIIPKKGKFFDYDEKYSANGAKEVTPAEISETVSNEVRKLANRIHATLGLGYYSRSDFIITKQKDIYYLETNPLPGMSQTSILPQQLQYSKNIRKFKRGLVTNTIKK